MLSAKGSLAIRGASRWLEAYNAEQHRQSNANIEAEVMLRFVKLVMISCVCEKKLENFDKEKLSQIPTQ